MAEENMQKEAEKMPQDQPETEREEKKDETPGQPEDGGAALEADRQAAEDSEAEQEKAETQEETEETKKKDKTELLIEELNDRIKRQMAEFENFRKRSEKEKSGMFEMGARSVIEQILPVVDNFERGLAAVSKEENTDPFVDGMDKVYRQMTEMLDKLGVKPIEAVGRTFDPEFHNAVMHAEDEESPENTIVEEFLKGYTYKDHVVRHSMVKVVN